MEIFKKLANNLAKSLSKFGFNKENPTLQDIQKWLREVKKIYVYALPYRCRDLNDCAKLSWYYSVIIDDDESDILCNAESIYASDNNYDTYDEALFDGLCDAIGMLTKE